MRIYRLYVWFQVTLIAWEFLNYRNYKLIYFWIWHRRWIWWLWVNSYVVTYRFDLVVLIIINLVIVFLANNCDRLSKIVSNRLDIFFSQTLFGILAYLADCKRRIITIIHSASPSAEKLFKIITIISFTATDRIWLCVFAKVLIWFFRAK